MAGTPTTNYNLPTIADGDVIDGVSAINGLATAVDTAYDPDTVPDNWELVGEEAA